MDAAESRARPARALLAAVRGLRGRLERRLTQLPAHPLERMEMLEQLRALGAGMAVGVAHTPHLSLGVDVPADVPVVEAELARRAKPSSTKGALHGPDHP